MQEPLALSFTPDFTRRVGSRTPERGRAGVAWLRASEKRPSPSSAPPLSNGRATRRSASATSSPKVGVPPSATCTCVRRSPLGGAGLFGRADRGPAINSCTSRSGNGRWVMNAPKWTSALHRGRQSCPARRGRPRWRRRSVANNATSGLVLGFASTPGPQIGQATEQLTSIVRAVMPRAKTRRRRPAAPMEL